MKNIYKFLLGFVLLAMLLMPANVAFAKGLQDGKVVFGDNYTLASGETLNGDLVVMGGAAEIQPEAKVRGNVIIMGGTLDVSGTITGDVVLIGGVASLSSTAVVEGNVVTIGGSLQKDEGALVKGEVVDTAGSTFQFDGKSFIPPVIESPAITSPQAIGGPDNFDIGYDPLWGALTSFGQALFIGLLAALVVVLLPNATNRVGAAATTQPVIAGGLGCLTLIITPIVLVMLGVLSIFIITIPITVSLIGIISIALAAGVIFGAIGIGLEIGHRMARAMNVHWAIPLEAALGTFLVVLVVNGISSLLFCFGWWAPVVFYTLGLGAVVMTRFGTHASVPPQAPVYAPPAAPAPAPAPVVVDEAPAVEPAPEPAAEDEPLPPAN